MGLDVCFCFTPQRIEKKRKEEKMDAGLNTSVAALILLGLIFYGGRGVEAQDTSCIPAITPCSSYLNTSGTPDKTCCDGLIRVIDKDAKCLCGLLNSTAIKQLGINMTKAMELPARCGKNVTADQCSKINSSGGAPAPTPTSDSSGGAPAPMPTLDSSGGASAPTPTSDSGRGAPTATPTSGGSSTPGTSPSSSTNGDSSGASSLVAALFSSVSLAAFFSVGLASQILMGGGSL